MTHSVTGAGLDYSAAGGGTNRSATDVIASGVERCDTVVLRVRERAVLLQVRNRSECYERENGAEFTKTVVMKQNLRKWPE